MRSLHHATDLLQPGETALVVFTDGRHFLQYQDGSGQSGNWKVDPNRRVDRVIVYMRVAWRNEIYLAHHAGTTLSPEPGRRIVQLKGFEAAGATPENWRDFADAYGPVRYVTG